MSVLNKLVSYYPDRSSTTNGIEINLLALLESKKHKDKIIALRECTDPALQKAMKDELPCYTVAGTFTRRSEDGLKELSGLGCVDLDGAEGFDLPYLLNQLKKIDSIAYCGLSCRGQRLYCIVPFLHPDKYLKHYESLVQSFESMGLPMGDTCHKAISQPRYVSYNEDDTQFFNHTAKPYHLLPIERTVHIIKSPKNITTATLPDNPFNWCNEQINKSHVFTSGRHAYIMALARYCNIKGIPESETLSGCLSYEQDDFKENEITGIVRHIYDKQKDSHNTIPFKNDTTANNLTNEKS